MPGKPNNTFTIAIPSDTPGVPSDCSPREAATLIVPLAPNADHPIPIATREASKLECRAERTAESAESKAEEMPPKKLRTSELEQQMLRSALEIIRSDEQRLTARTVAAAAGTSTGALYERFGDKAGLIKAVFHEGFRQCAAQVEALPTTSDARHDIVALLQVTRTFSKANPMLWKIMFGQPFTEFQPTATDYTAAMDIYAIVLARVDRLLAEAGRTTNHMDVARVLIATSRGLIDAELDGILGASQRSNDRRWNLAIDTLLDGLTNGPVTTRQHNRASR